MKWVFQGRPTHKFEARLRRASLVVKRRMAESAVLALAFALGLGALGLGAADRKIVQKAFITNNQGNDISVIDLRTMQVTATIVVGKAPHGVAVQADGRQVFTTIESEHALKIIDTAINAVTDSIPLDGLPNQLAVTPNGKFAAVPIRDGKKIDFVDLTLKKVVKTIPDKEPHNCFSPGDNRYLFCEDMGANLIYIVDVETKSIKDQIPVDGQPRPFGVTKNEKTIVTAIEHLHGFGIVDMASKVTQKVELPDEEYPANPLWVDEPVHGTDVTPDGREAWIASRIDDAVFVYNLATRQMVKRILTCKSPYWLSFSPDAKFAVVSNADSNDVSILDTASYKEVARVKVGKAPKRLVVGNVRAP